MLARPRLVYGRPTYGPPLAPTTMQSSVTQYGITWTFDQPYPVGQFVNGDYFVVGPVDVIDIDPLPEVVDGWYRNGCMNVFNATDTQGLDSQPGHGAYNHALNRGFPNGNPISSVNPLRVAENDVLISGASKGTTGNRPQLLNIAILTVVENVPIAGSFRPSYLIGQPRVSQWTQSDIDWNWLESVQLSRTPVQGLLSDPTDLLPVVRPLWWGLHSSGWERQGWGRRPLNSEMYGRELVSAYNDRVLHTLLDFPREDIEELVVSLVQIGLDTFAAAEQGVRWGPDGGHFQGHLLPIVFAGKMLGDADVYKYVNMETYAALGHENNQHFYVTQTDVDITQSGLISDGGTWDPDSRNIPGSILAYDESMIGLPEWGIRNSSTKTRNNAHWDAYYRSINTPLTSTALAFHIIGAAPDVVRGAFLDYCDRFMRMAYDSTYTDPAGSTFNEVPNWPSGLTVAMWEEFRDNYGPIWAP